MSLVLDDVLVTSNPATGAEVGRVRVTPTEQVAEIVARARAAQRPGRKGPGRTGETSWPDGREYSAAMPIGGPS